MLSLHAYERGTGLRRIAWDAAHAAMLIGAQAIDPLIERRWRAPLRPASTGAARLIPYPGFALAEVAGDPARHGAAWAALIGDQLRPLLELMRVHPAVALARMQGDAAKRIASLPDDVRAEIAALAAAAGVDETALALVNAGVVDACCSALVREARGGRPLAVARNLDFFPAGLLGRSTVVSIVRRDGRIPFANIGWPGCLGVVSGVNARGLSACILLNYAAVRGVPGPPLPCLARRILETCGDVDAAATAFAADLPASGHYLLLADERRAAVVWRDGMSGSRRHDLAAGWLACSNGGRDAERRTAIDARGRHLHGLAAADPDGRHATDAWMREAIGTTYLPGINVQAMLVIPGEQRVQLATGDARRPAAYERWWDLDLADALAGGSIADVRPRRLPRRQPAAHFLD